MADGITPSKLHANITKILAEESGCSASWAQHPEPLKVVELMHICARVTEAIGERMDQRDYVTQLCNAIQRTTSRT